MKDKFNNQFATQKLRQPSDEEAAYLRRQKEKEKQEDERIRQLFAKHGVKPVSIPPLEEEGSVTSPGEETEVTVNGIDSIIGLYKPWDSTIESLIKSGWDLEPQDIEDIKNGKTVKLISPNGRRISVSLKESDYMKHREDPEHYEKKFQKTGTSDYFKRRGLDEEGSVTSPGEATLPRWTGPRKKVGNKSESKERGTGKGYIFKDLWEELNENYSRFKKETKIKTESQQIHAAMRLAEKKLAEANRILEYTGQLRRELAETKYSSHTHKVMERMVKNIAEAYKKIKELSPRTFKSAINVSKERGTDRRTQKLGRLYFNKFIGMPLLGGKIVDIVVSNPQQANYRQVNIQVEHEFKNAPVVPDSLKYSFVHYDIDEDIFDVGEVERKDAVVLSKIAQHINPDTKYKQTGMHFDIKGHR